MAPGERKQAFAGESFSSHNSRVLGDRRMDRRVAEGSLAKEPAASSSSIRANRPQGRGAKLGSGRLTLSHASPAAEGMLVFALRARLAAEQAVTRR